jgi:hypothetical protein
MEHRDTPNDDAQKGACAETKSPLGQMTVSVVGSRGHLAAHEGLEIAFHGKILNLVVGLKDQSASSFGNLEIGILMVSVRIYTVNPGFGLHRATV